MMYTCAKHWHVKKRSWLLENLVFLFFRISSQVKPLPFSLFLTFHDIYEQVPLLIERGQPSSADECLTEPAHLLVRWIRLQRDTGEEDYNFTLQTNMTKYYPIGPNLRPKLPFLWIRNDPPPSQYLSN